MFVEYGKLKMFLITLNGLLVPLQTTAADFLPEWFKLVSLCISTASTALFAYLLKPASEKDISSEENSELVVKTGEKN